MNNQNNIYFPNLNGIRFIAALLVIIHHIEQLKSLFNLKNYWNKSSFIEIIGSLGVVLFFVLSGFLITFLLLTEESKTLTISIKKFYIRRILRIWPLYFLIIVLSLFVLPYVNFFLWPEYSREIIQQNLWLKILFYFTFFANLVFVWLGVIPYATQTWSIGTEEQFYLVWPIILKNIKHNRVLLMIIIIIGYLLIKIFLNNQISDIIPFKNYLKSFWDGFTIDCMAIGGLFAVLLFNKSKKLQIVLDIKTFYFALIILIYLIVNGIKIPYLHTQIYSLLFGVVIINLAANVNIRGFLENKYFNYLGQISYGLYMFHPIGIIITIRLFLYLGFFSNILIYLFSIIITITISSLSYKYFETWFLNLKPRFSNIESSNSPK